MRVHIGHRVWNPGNVGDAWTLAGFLEAWRSLDPHGTVTCATFHPEGAARIRFPGVEWITSDFETRFEAVRDCDVWLALGGTPFEADPSSGAETVPSREWEWCQALRKPMFYLGVGVGEPATIANPRMRKVIKTARRIWARDALSASALREVSTLAKVRQGADPAHNYFSASVCAEAPLTDASQPDFETAFGWAIDSHDGAARGPVAMEQALRAYPGVAHYRLGAKGESAGLARAGMQPCAVHLTSANVDGLTAKWPSCRTIITDRPHWAAWGAWNGSRLVAVAEKAGPAEIEHSFGCERVENLSDTATVKRAIGRSRSVAPARLLELSALAFESCREFHREAVAATAVVVCEKRSVQRPAKPQFSLGAYAERIRGFFGWGEAERQRRAEATALRGASRQRATP